MHLTRPSVIVAVAFTVLLAVAAAWIVRSAGRRGPGSRQAAPPPGPIPERPELRDELLRRVAEDQRIRQQVVNGANREGTSPQGPGREADPPSTLLRAMAAIDEANTRWLADLIGQGGWPGRRLVGADGAHAAWLLVQHAKDLALQDRCLKLMHEAPEGEVAPADIAYLEDRVRLAEGKKQLYGTQVENLGDGWRAKEVEAPEGLDQRRKAMGMPPMDLYLKMVTQAYGEKAFAEPRRDASPSAR